MKKNEKGSIELIVLALLAALIVVLAIPLLQNMGSTTQGVLSDVNNDLESAATAAASARPAP